MLSCISKTEQDLSVMKRQVSPFPKGEIFFYRSNVKVGFDYRAELRTAKA